MLDVDSQYQNIELEITEGECSLVWHRRARNMPSASIGTVGGGSRRSIIDQTWELRCGIKYLLRKKNQGINVEN